MNINATPYPRLPPAPQAAGNYQPVKSCGTMLYTAGHTSAVAGVLEYQGLIGVDLTLSEARASAATAVLNCLASLDNHAGGLENISEIISMTGYLCASQDFSEHTQVLDAASEVLISYFGDHGRPARAALGVSSLPGQAPVEISLIASLKNS